MSKKASCRLLVTLFLKIYLILTGKFTYGKKNRKSMIPIPGIPWGRGITLTGVIEPRTRCRWLCVWNREGILNLEAL